MKRKTIAERIRLKALEKNNNKSLNQTNLYKAKYYTVK